MGPPLANYPYVTTKLGRILIVEDNVDNQWIYTTILQHKGFTVLTANDGVSGMAKAKEEHPDLILMDVSIPGVDGWQATAGLKADESTSTIPIIILTAHALAADRAKAKQVGANGYIAKPADPRTVVAAVEETLANPDFRVGFP